MAVGVSTGGVVTVEPIVARGCSVSSMELVKYDDGSELILERAADLSVGD